MAIGAKSAAKYGLRMMMAGGVSTDGWAAPAPSSG